MANIIKIKRSTGSTAPSSLSQGELAYSEGLQKLYIGTDGAGIDTLAGLGQTELITAQTAETSIDGDNDYLLIYDASATGFKKVLTKYVGSLSALGITASAAELNTLDGITATTAELNTMDGITATTAELNTLDGYLGSVTEFNYLKDVYDTGVTAAELNILDGITSTTAELNILDGDTSATSTTIADTDRLVLNDNGTMVQVAVTDLDTYVSGTTKTLTNKTLTSPVLNTPTITGNTTFSDGAYNFNIASHDGTNGLALAGTVVTSSAAELNILDGVTSTTSELNLVDGSTAGSVVNSKAVIYGSSGEVNATTLQIGGSSITSTAAELNLLDGVTAGTATANLALVVDANKDIDLDGGDLTATNLTGTLQTASQTNITAVGTLNGITIASSQTIDMGSNRVTSVATPTSSSDAATKGYVDAVKTGLDFKDSVRAASTENVDISTELTNGDTIDGVTLATGDRVLLKDQSTGSQNGIYVVVASGAASRSTDMDADSEVTGGAFVYVNEGSTNGDAAFVISTNDDITVDTTAITWTQFSGAGQITAGDGLSKTGNTLAVQVDDSSIEIDTDTVRVKALGITNAMLAGSIDLTAKVTGTLPIGNGGTGITTAPKGSVLIANAADTISALDGGAVNDGILSYSASTDTVSWATTIDGGTYS